MNLLSIISEPAILIIVSIFLIFILFVLKNYVITAQKLKQIYVFLTTLNKKELSYRFGQLDDFMRANSYTNICWEDFKKALIIPDKMYTASKNSQIVDEYNHEIFLTLDSSYFFNEETLINSKINYKFIQTMPTLLTGLGPFFTFLKMAYAFSSLDLSSAEVNESLGMLLENVKIAALCSVFAVGLSLLFMFVEKILYNKMCKRYYLLIQKELIRLFDVCTSEQFLLDLVKESKLQNISNEKVFRTLPDEISKSVIKALQDTTTPYLENILYSLNKLNEEKGKNDGGDIVDKLF